MHMHHASISVSSISLSLSHPLLSFHIYISYHSHRIVHMNSFQCDKLSNSQHTLYGVHMLTVNTHLLYDQQMIQSSIRCFLVFAGWENKRTTLRRKRQDQELTFTYTDEILTKNCPLKLLIEITTGTQDYDEYIYAVVFY